MPISESEAQKLIAAHRTLEIDIRASATAIRYRYRELARLNHPDKHPAGSAAQKLAAARMAEINAAYELIQSAPLEHYEPPEPIRIEPEAPRAPVGFGRPMSVLTETLVRLVFGALCGISFALYLDRKGVPGFWVYAPVLAFVCGFGFTSTNENTLNWLRSFLFWTPRI